MGTAVRHKGEQKGKIVENDGRSIYHTRRGGDGYVNKYEGFGITSEILEELEHRTDEIIVEYNNQYYATSPKVWLENGTRDQLGDFEEQVFIPIDMLHEVDIMAEQEEILFGDDNEPSDEDVKTIKTEAASNKKPRLGIKSKSGDWYNFSNEGNGISMDEAKSIIEEHNFDGAEVDLTLTNDGKYVDIEVQEEGESNYQSSSSSGNPGQNSSGGRMNDYITWEETLKRAHEEFEEFSINTERVVEDKDREQDRELFKATVETPKGTFTGYGDASADNTTGDISDALPRMAETRAKVRALKDSLGIGKVSKQEVNN